MSYSLSFSYSFYWPDPETPFEEIEPSDKPTSVFQAIKSLHRDIRVEIARELFGSRRHAEYYADSEEFALDVMDMIRETDSCDNLFSTPVTVYIDQAGFYTVTVYGE